MKIFELIRFEVIEPGAFGILLDPEGSFICFTLEHTYEQLRVKIPSGVHRVTRSWYYRGGYETFEVHVQGYSRLLFHKGNVEQHSDGCVITGLQLGSLSGKRAVLRSAGGFVSFMKATSGLNEFSLSVRTPVNPRSISPGNP